MHEQYFISVPFFKWKLVYKARDIGNLSKFASKTGPYFTPCYPFSLFLYGKRHEHVFYNLEKVLSSWKVLEFSLGLWKVLVLISIFGLEKSLNYARHLFLRKICVRTTFYSCSFFSNVISVPHMQLQVTHSHFASKGVKECQFIH